MAIVVSVVAIVVSVVVIVVSVVVSSEVVASGEVPPPPAPGAADDVVGAGVGTGVVPGVSVADVNGSSVELRHAAALLFLLQSGPVLFAKVGEDRKQHIMKMFSKRLIIFWFSFSN